MQTDPRAAGRFGGQEHRSGAHDNGGGNDARFADIILSCFVPVGLPQYGGGNGNDCKARIEWAGANLSEIMKDVEGNIERLLSEKMSGNPSS